MMIDKDNCIFSYLYNSLLAKKHCMILLFTLAIKSAFAKCQCELERLKNEFCFFGQVYVLREGVKYIHTFNIY